MAGLTTNNDKHELFILFSRGLCYVTLGYDFHKLKNVVIAGSPGKCGNGGFTSKESTGNKHKTARFELMCLGL